MHDVNSTTCKDELISRSPATRYSALHRTDGQTSDQYYFHSQLSYPLAAKPQTCPDFHIQTPTLSSKHYFPEI